MYVAWLSIQYQAFTYSTASGTYGFSRVRMIFRFITIRATEPCLNLEYSGFRSRETNSPYNLIGGARRRLSSRDRVQPPLALSHNRGLHSRSIYMYTVRQSERARIARAHAHVRTYIRDGHVKGSAVFWSSGQEKELHEVKGSRLIFGGQES